MSTPSLSPEAGRTRFRKLQIAWSVLCGLACVLLIALWVRSYDALSLLKFSPQTGDGFRLVLVAGHLEFGFGPAFASSLQWHYFTSPKLSDIEVFLDAFNYMKLRLGFGYISDGSNWRYVVPIWFPVLLTIALGALPWLRRRFSLRTLLIATTLIALALGLVVWAAKN